MRPALPPKNRPIRLAEGPSIAEIGGRSVTDLCGDQVPRESLRSISWKRDLEVSQCHIPHEADALR